MANPHSTTIRRACAGLSLLALALPGVAAAQQWRVGALFTSIPVEYSTDSRDFTIGPEGDTSPVPTEITYRADAVHRFWPVGIYARKAKQGGGVVPLVVAETNYLNLFSSESMQFNFVTAGIGLALESGGHALRVSLYGMPTLTYVTGELGEVGNAPGDGYLGAPDGNDYQVGATIHGWHFRIGGEVGAGIRLGEVLQIDGFYRASYGNDTWKYEVREDGNRSELPEAAFKESPPAINFSGFGGRAAILAFKF